MRIVGPRNKLGKLEMVLRSWRLCPIVQLPEVNMATPGITKALEGFDRLKTRMKNAEIAKHVKEERAYAAGAAVVGALIAGAADAKYRAPDGTTRKVGPIPAVGGASAVLALAGLTDLVPGGVYIGMAGIGGLCYVAGKFAHDHVAENANATP